MTDHKIFVGSISVVFVGLALVFNLFPRSAYSELERRELSRAPQMTIESLRDGSFMRQTSAWFSDSEPFRDEFMALSMHLRSRASLSRANAEDNIKVHVNPTSPAPSATVAHEEAEPAPMAEPVVQPAAAQIDTTAMAEASQASVEPADEDNVEERAKLADSGTIVLGSAPNARALMIYGGRGGGKAYAAAADRYQEEFPEVQVWCMAIPIATDFYLPAKAAKMSQPQITTINSIAEHLQKAKSVIVYDVLKAHKDEPIYLRTDHHWSALGSYYAARVFCEAAGVPVPDKADYEEHVIHRFVGTMYGYTKDPAIKNSPEDFPYWTPRNVDYNTTFITFRLDSAMHIRGESKPTQGQFFQKFKDGSSAAYCTFMGGDMKITQVRTSTANGRRLLILKDSYGNALPGWLFGSFEEVHVVDFRYFNKNMKQYVADNAITDILFANNTFNAYSGNTARRYLRFLTQ